jgi:hypothetical protein
MSENNPSPEDTLGLPAVSLKAHKAIKPLVRITFWERSRLPVLMDCAESDSMKIKNEKNNNP